MPKKEKKIKVKKISSFNVFLNKHFKIIKIVVSILVVVFMLLFLVQPKYVEVNQEKTIMFQQKSSELEGFKQYTESLQELEKTVKNYKKLYGNDIERLSQLLPSKADIPNLMAQLEEVTQVSGFRLSSLNFTESSVDNKNDSKSKTEEVELNPLDLPELNDSVRIVRISMNVNGGDYFQIKTLLNNIEKHLRIIDLNSIGFSGGKIDTPITLSLNTYYYAP